MKSVWKSILACVVVLMAGLASAQTFSHFNQPPCDFSDRFYHQNGIDTGQLVGRFGIDPITGVAIRQFGPPSTSSTQANWVADSNCSLNEPVFRNFRILETTGAFNDFSGQDEFFSLVAFLESQSVFETTFNDTEGDNPITIGTFEGKSAPAQNPRGYTMQFIIGNFEAYGGTKQTITLNGQQVLAPTPCGTLADPTIATNDCFPLGKVSSNGLLAVETPNLRQDWRIAANRSSIDGSDNNCINGTAQNCKRGHQSDSPFGYFCDDLLGAWIVTYFWYTQFSVGGNLAAGGTVTPTANCNKVLSCISSIFGNNLDGTPIIKTGNQLHFIEGVPGTSASEFAKPVNANNQNGVSCMTDQDLPPASAPCGAEGNLDQTGKDGGAVWLICPDIPDPRNGAIASDAFLDAVRKADGTFLDNQDPSLPTSATPTSAATLGGTLSANFTCLQQTGKFCNESAPGQ